METELQRLLDENTRLHSFNEDLAAELQHIKATSMEHIENMERELELKYTNSAQTEQLLIDLQNQFLAFRDDKLAREAELKAEIERWREDREAERVDRER